MHFTTLLTATAAAVPLVAAHGGAPRIFGLGEGALRPRDLGFAARRAATPHSHKINKRQGGVDGQCGPSANGAKCDDGYCCSGAGWCGTGEEYCAAPDCLIDFGTGCDAHAIPNGESTINVPRTQLGSIEYGGEGIYPCREPGTVAITYDDGPYIYTDGVLDLFAQYNMKATFFITGNNLGKGPIDDAATPWPAVITRMMNEGHQVASHTWSHQDLSAITHDQRVEQMVNNEMALRNILQKFPTYMRPPYSSCTAASGCEQDMKDLGYVVVYFDIDTTDYLNTTPDKIQNAKDVFAGYIQNSNPTTDTFLSIEHDIHQQTAQNLTVYMLQMLQDKGYRGVTVGECLGDPEANWYRASSGKIVTSSSARPSATQTSSAAPTATPTGVSVDGTCGAAVGLTCLGFSEGSCCSPAGWCGATEAYCGTGCQSGFGTCGKSTTDVPSSSAPSATTGSSSSAAPSAAPSNVTPSVNGQCGPALGFTCKGWAEASTVGECCSNSGWCGSSTDHCSAGSCNPAYGVCEGSNSAAPSFSLSLSASASASASAITSASSCADPLATVAADGSCTTTVRSTTTISSAAVIPTTSVAPVPSATSTSTAPAQPTKAPSTPVSTNGRCGSRNGGTTCKGYRGIFNWQMECCGVTGFCGNDFFSCRVRCQSEYGNCW
ncbi:unnamed protein product [Periconia digitata]|uniref:Chitin deacetylase n=1 Tax=Periconia digitata TaxID=1303443 RepID=A0A9W4XK78_9PLEO|nr:unnamed protein product [Periconia digitata]